MNVFHEAASLLFSEIWGVSIDSSVLVDSMNYSLVVDPIKTELVVSIALVTQMWFSFHLSSDYEQTYIIAWWRSLRRIGAIRLVWVSSWLCCFSFFRIWIPKTILHIYIQKTTLISQTSQCIQKYRFWKEDDYYIYEMKRNYNVKWIFTTPKLSENDCLLGGGANPPAPADG